jgi:hypothetical protein
VTVRHYGIYARGRGRFFRKLLGVVNMVQRKFDRSKVVMGSRVLEVWGEDSLDRPPPEFELVKEPMFGERMTDWGYIASSSIAR